ncbi:MAG: ABC transporter ATP-binding protein [Pseudomonadota bacterium]
MSEAAVANPASALFAVRRIWHEARVTSGFASLLTFSLLAALFNSALVLPVTMQRVIGGLESGNGTQAIFSLLAIAFVLLMVGYISEWVANRYAARVNEGICLRVTDRQVEGYLRSSLATFQQQPKQTYSAAVGEVAEGLQTHQFYVLQTGVLSVAVTVFSLGLLAQYNAWFFVIMLPFLFAVCGLPMLLANQAGRYLDAEPDAFASVGAFVDALEAGRRDWYFAPTQYLLGEAERRLDDLHHAQTGKWWIWNLSFNTKMTQNLVLNALTLLVAGLLYFDGRIDLGMAVGSYLLVSMIAPKFDGLYKLYNFAQASAAAYDALDRARLDISEPVFVEQSEQDEVPIRSIALNVFNFCHRGASKPVIEEASLVLKSGDRCLITGPSGSGKSTLVDLMLGSLSGPNVRLQINGKDLSEWGRENFWGGIAYVPNPDLLLEGRTARNNLEMYGDIAVLERTGWLQAFGWDRFSDTMGAGLSGGEKQRVSILRAVSRRRGMIVLDEPTSALDDANTRKVFEILSQPSPEIVVVVSHNIVARDHFDRVFEIRGGRLVELS